MTFKFRPAKRAGVHLLLGLSGGTGSGKTYSALELATGLAGGQRFAVIDTEAGRAQHYADTFAFDHGDLAPPFGPSRYLEAIVAAEAEGYPVVVVDSMSHEHAGEGGVLELHEKELDRMAGQDYKKRERCNMTAWIRPKAEHGAMVSRLLQLRIHLILCFRAQPKTKVMKVVENGREVSKPVDVGWQPICARGLDFEMSASWMLRHERPGQVFDGDILDSDPIGYPIKLPEPLRYLFTGAQVFTREHGSQMAAWAAGSANEPTATSAAQEVDVDASAKAEQALREVGALDDFVEVHGPPDGWGADDITAARAAYKTARKRSAA